MVKETATITPTRTGGPTPSAARVTPTGNTAATPIASPSVNTIPTLAPTPAGPKSYSLAEVAKHSSDSSCWSAINGKVYDLTAWIGQHPGGKNAILSICGKDGSSAFNDQHGGQRRPANELAGYEIGILAQ